MAAQDTVHLHTEFSILVKSQLSDGFLGLLPTSTIVFEMVGVGIWLRRGGGVMVLQDLFSLVPINRHVQVRVIISSLAAVSIEHYY